MWLFLEAIDVWLFRDGRPFDAQSDHRAESLFPPYPTVIQGAVRSHHLALQPDLDLSGRDQATKDRIKGLVGDALNVRDLRLRGPFVAWRENGRIIPYFPQPADAVTVEKDKHTLRPAQPPKRPGDGVTTSAPTERLLGLDEEPEKGESGLWLGEDELQRYLKGGTEATVTGVPAEELFRLENRIGIGRDDHSRAGKDEALFEVEFIRPCEHVGLLIDVEGYDGWPASGLMRIGGEGRGAYFGPAEVSPWPELPDPLPARFKLYFATPAYFDGGWQPVDSGWGRYFDGEVSIVAAAVGRYESVGGYDVAGNQHKPSRRYVPAGSVYYFESDGLARLKRRAVTDSPTGNDFEANIGFGQVIVEEW